MNKKICIILMLVFSIIFEIFFGVHYINATNAESSKSKEQITYTSHVQDIGWQS